MTLARMMMRNPRIRIRSPTAIGTAICHDGMGGTGGRFEMHFYTNRKALIQADCADNMC